MIRKDALLKASAKQLVSLPIVELPEKDFTDCNLCRRCYGSNNCEYCSDCKYCSYCTDCSDCYQCHNCFKCLECYFCKNCIGISGGYNLQFVVFGVQLTEEQYMDVIIKLKEAKYID